jgi:glycosyltransferase A (GT-A) superfamily protein (DUF2064 family)
VSAPYTTLLIIAKQPLPGRVKTRLVPPCTHEQASALAEAALTDTLHTMLMVPARRRILVLEGEAGPWLPAGFDVVPQGGGPLDERIADAFAAVRGPALLIGMDTPQVTPGLLTVDWRGADAVLGPAADGGFWALGLRVPDPALLRGVPMSTPATGAIQRARLLAAGLRVADLPRLRDVDTAADAVAVARQAPQTRFAALARELAMVLSPAGQAKASSGKTSPGTYPSGKRHESWGDRPVRRDTPRAGRGAGAASGQGATFEMVILAVSEPAQNGQTANS